MLRQLPIWFSPNPLSSVFRLNDSGEDGAGIASNFSPTTRYYWLAWLAICLEYILIRLNTVSVPLDRVSRVPT